MATKAEQLRERVGDTVKDLDPHGALAYGTAEMGRAMCYAIVEELGITEEMVGYLTVIASELDESDVQQAEYARMAADALSHILEASK